MKRQWGYALFPFLLGEGLASLLSASDPWFCVLTIDRNGSNVTYFGNII